MDINKDYLIEWVISYIVYHVPSNNNPINNKLFLVSAHLDPLKTFIESLNILLNLSSQRFMLTLSVKWRRTRT